VVGGSGAILDRRDLQRPFDGHVEVVEIRFTAAVTCTSSAAFSTLTSAIVSLAASTVACA